MSFSVAKDIRKGNLAGLEEFLTSDNGDVNALVNRRGTTLLIYAAEYGQTELVKKILEKGANVNLQNTNGMTALMKAYKAGHMDIVGLLLEYGADWSIRNNLGKTAHFYLRRSLSAREQEMKKQEDEVHEVHEEANDGDLGNHQKIVVRPEEVRPPPLQEEKQYDDEIDAWIYSTRNILDLKIVYTIVSHNYRCGYIDMDDFRSYVLKALEHTAQLLSITADSIIFKYVLKKAESDGLITEFERKKFKVEATKAVVLNSDTMKSMKQSIYNIQGRLDSLERSMNHFQQGNTKSIRIRAALAFPKALLNIFTLGVVGSAMEAIMDVAMSQIVDFGDIAHISSIVSNTSDSESMQMLQEGVDEAENGPSEIEEIYEDLIDEAKDKLKEMLEERKKQNESSKYDENDQYNSPNERKKDLILKQIGFVAQLSQKEAQLVKESRTTLSDDHVDKKFFVGVGFISYILMLIYMQNFM